MVIAIVQQKGGCGKSTIAAHFAGRLHKAGRRVAVLDCDVQGSVSRWLAEAEPGIHVEVANDPDDILRALNRLKGEYDAVLADGPAGLAEATRSLVWGADLAILPSNPGVLDLRSLQKTIGTVRTAQELNQGRPKALLVLNRMDQRTRLAADAQEAIHGLGIPVAECTLGQRAAFGDAPGQSAFVWGLSSGREAAKEIDLLLQEVLQYGEGTTNSESGTG